MCRYVLIVGILLIAFSGIGQNINKVSVTKTFYGYTKLRVIQELEEDYGLNIDYNGKLSELKKAIFPGKSYKKATVSTVMDALVSNSNLHYKIMDNMIIIRLKSEEIKSVFERYERKSDFNQSGSVRDKYSGESLPYAQVVVEGTNNGTTTNIDGYFTLFHVPVDTSTLIVSYVGYEMVKIKLNPQLTSESLTIELKPTNIELNEVTVIGESNEVMKVSEKISKISVTPAQIKTLPSIGEQDLFRTFQLMPGISASNESSSGLYVRGGTPDQNLILYDGFTVYHVDHLFGMFSAFNPNAIKDVQLSKGGFESKYGGCLSSVMEITGKDGNEKNYNIGANVGLISANGFLELPINDKGSFIIMGRRSFQSDLYNTLSDSYQDESETAMPMRKGPGGRSMMESEPTSYFYDLNAKATYRIGTDDILSLSFYNGEDNIDNSKSMNLSFGGMGISGGTEDLSNWGNWGTSLKWSKIWNEKLYSNSLASFSQYYSIRNMTVERNLSGTSAESFKRGTEEENRLKDVSFKSDFEYQLNNSNKIGFGVNYSHYILDYDYLQNDTIVIQNQHSASDLVSVYLQDEITFGNNLILTPGIRGSYYANTSKFYLEPRLSAAYKLRENIKLKFAWGKYYQYANRIIRSDLQSGSRDFWVLSDDEVVPVGSAFHYILGASWDHKNYLIDVEAYYKTLDGLSEYAMTFVPSFRAINYDEFYYQGTGTAKGVDILLQKKYGKFNGWIGYTIGEVLYNFPDLSKEKFHASHDATHEIKIVASYRWNKWTFSGSWIYATGKPYTEPVGTYSVLMPDGTEQDYLYIGQKNGSRLPDYHRLDFSISREMILGKFARGNLSFSLFNAYDRTNVWYKEFELLEGELIETDVNLLGITPNISLQLKLR